MSRKDMFMIERCKGQVWTACQLRGSPQSHHDSLLAPALGMQHTAGSLPTLSHWSLVISVRARPWQHHTALRILLATLILIIYLHFQVNNKPHALMSLSRTVAVHLITTGLFLSLHLKISSEILNLFYSVLLFKIYVLCVYRHVHTMSIPSALRGQKRM